MQRIKAKQGIHRQNNAHFDAMKFKNNSHLTVHSLYLLMGINLSLVLLRMFFLPKHLKLFACGKPSRNSSNKACEGYRIPATKKITQNHLREAKA